MGRRVGFRHGFESWLCYLLAAWPWAGVLTSLSPHKAGCLPPRSGAVGDNQLTEGRPPAQFLAISGCAVNGSEMLLKSHGCKRSLGLGAFLFWFGFPVSY